MDEEIDPDLINSFNDKYNSNLLLPINYDFHSDFKIQERKERMISFFDIEEENSILLKDFDIQI